MYMADWLGKAADLIIYTIIIGVGIPFCVLSAAAFLYAAWSLKSLSFFFLSMSPLSVLWFSVYCLWGEWRAR